MLYVIKTNWSNKKNNTFTKIVNTYQPNYLIKFENNFEEILKFVNNIFSFIISLKSSTPIASLFIFTSL